MGPQGLTVPRQGFFLVTPVDFSGRWTPSVIYPIQFPWTETHLTRRLNAGIVPPSTLPRSPSVI
jgi:hypothetical protein